MNVQARESVYHGKNCIVGQKSYNINFFSFRIRNFVTPIIESVRTPERITPYPTGRLFWGGAVPGTSCQATIAPSLRDISQQALANRLASPLQFGRALRESLDHARENHAVDWVKHVPVSDSQK